MKILGGGGEALDYKGNNYFILTLRPASLLPLLVAPLWAALARENTEKGHPQSITCSNLSPLWRSQRSPGSRQMVLETVCRCRFLRGFFLRRGWLSPDDPARIVGCPFMRRNIPTMLANIYSIKIYDSIAHAREIYSRRTMPFCNTILAFICSLSSFLSEDTNKTNLSINIRIVHWNAHSFLPIYFYQFFFTCFSFYNKIYINYLPYADTNLRRFEKTFF